VLLYIVCAMPDCSFRCSWMLGIFRCECSTQCGCDAHVSGMAVWMSSAAVVYRPLPLECMDVWMWLYHVVRSTDWFCTLPLR